MDEPPARPGVLPANVDDPRFRPEPSADHARHAAWSGTDAIVASVTDPVDTAVSAACSPENLLSAAVESLVELLLALALRQ